MNALSISTWIVHISSVLEWLAAMALVWRFAGAIGQPQWRLLTWAMLPALVSAFCACTWHFFDNAPSLNWLVTLQAALTVAGNCTLCLAAWQIWRAGRLVGS
jgi:hypothetical protein